jgi:hypothetical protein
MDNAWLSMIAQNKINRRAIHQNHYFLSQVAYIAFVAQLAPTTALPYAKIRVA